MARLRTLKPGFFTNDQLAELPFSARLLFAGLWCIADREGRLPDRPKKIKAEIFPYDGVNVEKLLVSLSARGFIERYESHGERCIQIVTFKKHQNPHVKEPPSTLPAPDAPVSPPVQEPDEHSASPVLAPDENSESRAVLSIGLGSGLGSGLQSSEPEPGAGSVPGAAGERARIFAHPKPGQTPEALAHREAIVGWLVGTFHGLSPPNTAERERLQQAAGLFYESHVGTDELPRLFEAARDRWSGDAEINPLSVARRVGDLRQPKQTQRRNGRQPPTDPREQSRRVALSVLAEEAAPTPPRRALA